MFIINKNLYDLKKAKEKLISELDRIDFELSKETLSEGYEYSLEEYSKRYKRVIQKSFKDRKEVSELLHMMINKIIVYSRPKNNEDSISGRKKKNQLIPNRIDIYLNLPQDLIQELIKYKFEVKNDNV